MVTITIQQALRPFFIMRFLMGLGVYPIKQSELKIRWIVYFSMIYSLIIWFIYAYFFFYILNFFTLKVIYLTFINVIVIAINIFSLFISIIMNFYYQKVHTYAIIFQIYSSTKLTHNIFFIFSLFFFFKISLKFFIKI